LATSFVDGRTVFGVDPAAAMLDIARRRPGGDKVAWVHADAQSVRLGRRFDLVLLTGHAFQVFLTGEDQKAVFSTIAAHLAPEGRFIFVARRLDRRALHRHIARNHSPRPASLGARWTPDPRPLYAGRYREVWP
jgi:SAM-dependent methyltransferase